MVVELFCMNSIRLAFRLVHIANIPHILAQGFVHDTSPRANPLYVPIGDSSAIAVRRRKAVDATSFIGDYIPFYFGPRSPMLYVIQHGHNNVIRCAAEDLVYCVIGIKDIITGGIRCQFTDGHALNEMTKFYPGGDLPKLNDIVRYEDVYEPIGMMRMTRI